MERTAICPMTKQQTAVSTCVFRVIFDDLSGVDHAANFRRTDHTLRPRHLLDSMGKKQHFSYSGLANFLQDSCMCVHMGYSKDSGALLQLRLGWRPNASAEVPLPNCDHSRSPESVTGSGHLQPVVRQPTASITQWTWCYAWRHDNGRMFWFLWKKFAGSYLVLISRSRR
jgi:hypothetical protein